MWFGHRGDSLLKVMAVTVPILYFCHLFSASASQDEVLISWDRRAGWDLVNGGQWMNMPEMVLSNDGTFIFTRLDQSSERFSVRINRIPPEKMLLVKAFLLKYLTNPESNEQLQTIGQVDDAPLTTVTIRMDSQRKVVNFYGVLSANTNFLISELSELLESLKSADAKEYFPEVIWVLIHKVNESYVKNYTDRRILEWSLSPSIGTIFSSAKDVGNDMRIARVEGENKASLTAHLEDKTPVSKQKNEFLFKSDGGYYEVSYRPVLPNENE